MATSTYGSPYVESSDLVSGWPAASSNVADRIDDVSIKGNGLNNQAGTTYTTVLTDAGKAVVLDNASAVTVTIPPNSSVAYETGSVVKFINLGAGTVTLSPGSGVTLNGADLTIATNKASAACKVATDEWVVLSFSGGEPGLVLVAHESFTTQSTVSVDDCFTSKYDNYRVMLNINSSSAGTGTRMRLRASSTDSTSGYAYSFVYFTMTAAAGNAQAVSESTFGSTAEWLLNDTFTSTGVVAGIEIMRPFIAQPTGISWHGQRMAAGTAGGVMQGWNSASTSYDGITVYPVTGTITGSLSIYGYRNTL